MTGDGSQADPFVFTPNYIYATTGKTNVKDGVSIAVDAAHYTSSDKGTANPGDGFKAMSRIRVGSDKVQFMQQLGYYTASRYLLGVGETTYGYRYSKAKALPFSFVSEDRTLYYFEKSDSGTYQFSETKPPLRNTFSPSDSTIYTVIWKDHDNSVLDEETYYVGVTPTYKKGTPARAAHDQYQYTFSGWTPAITAVTADAAYTATYTQSERLFCYHSLTLDGDIGLNFYLNVSEAQINTGSGVVVDFSWNVDGTAKTASCRLDTTKYSTKNGRKYYRATCYLPAAEMTYTIRAAATINGALQDETDDYSVRQYADVILETSSDATLVTLVKTMLDYGAKAQTVFGRNTGNLANKGVDYTMPNVEADDISTATVDMETGLSEAGLAYYSSGIIFLSKSTLRHYYTIVDQDKFDAVKGSVTFGGDPVTYKTKGDYIYFDCPNVAAAELDDAQTIRFGDKCSYSYSVLDFVRKLAVGGGTQADLAKATYCYNQAANAYFPAS